MSGISLVVVKNLKIDTIKNESDFGSKSCGDYASTTSKENTVPGFQGANVRGITVESSKDVKFEGTSVYNLIS